MVRFVGGADVSEARVGLCVDDDPRVRALVADELARRGLVARGCASVREALLALRVPPALAVVDWHLPDGLGDLVLRRLAEAWPGTPAVVLTVDDRPAQVLAALRAGACGYLLKEDLSSRLSATLDEACAGRLPLSSGVAGTVLRHLRDGRDEGPAVVTLTVAEQAVLGFLAKGLSYEQCAVGVGVSINTVRTHVRSVYRKLEVSTKTEAVLAALRRGLIEAP